MYDIRDYFETPEDDFFHREEDVQPVESQGVNGLYDNVKSSVVRVFFAFKKVLDY